MTLFLLGDTNGRYFKKCVRDFVYMQYKGQLFIYYSFFLFG